MKTRELLERVNEKLFWQGLGKQFWSVRDHTGAGA